MATKADMLQNQDTDEMLRFFFELGEYYLPPNRLEKMKLLFITYRPSEKDVSLFHV